MTERQKLVSLMTKLIPAIRNRIISQHGYPKDRNRLVSKAEVLYNMMKKNHDKGGQRTQTPAKAKTAKPDTARKDDASVIEKSKENKERTTKGLCWTCGSADHFHSVCPVKSARKLKWEEENKAGINQIDDAEKEEAK